MKDIEAIEGSWAARWNAAEQWTLTDALAWIVFRDPVIASENTHEAPDLYTDHPDIVAAVARLNAQSVGAAETRPLEALKLACLKGDVQAFGSGDTESPTPIASGDWADLEFRPASIGHEMVVRDEGRRAATHGRELSAPRFDSASVKRAFPAPEPWRLGPGESLTSYAHRPEVVEEAMRRRLRDSEASLCEAMAEISGRSAKSIAYIRRRFRSLISKG